LRNNRDLTVIAALGKPHLFRVKLFLCPMTYYNLRLLSPTVQLYWVLKHGTSLDTRYNSSVTLA